MAGKTTILDRLMQEGKIVPKIGLAEVQKGFVRDPLNFPVETHRVIRESEGPRANRILSMTPEREVYQQGLESLRRQKMKPIREEEIDARERFEELQDDFNDAYSDAYESWQDDMNSSVPDEAPMLEYGFAPEDLDFPVPSTDLRNYWPPYAKHYDVFEREADDLRDELEAIDDRMDYARSPEYIQQLQTQTPRYRNYQRAMQQRAANKQIGHQLSRMWGDAYNRLRARGLSDAEARMFIRERFGGR